MKYKCSIRTYLFRADENLSFYFGNLKRFSDLQYKLKCSHVTETLLINQAYWYLDCIVQPNQKQSSNSISEIVTNKIGNHQSQKHLNWFRNGAIYVNRNVYKLPIERKSSISIFLYKKCRWSVCSLCQQILKDYNPIEWWLMFFFFYSLEFRFIHIYRCLHLTSKILAEEMWFKLGISKTSKTS